MESGNCAVYKKVKKTVVGEVEMKLNKTTTQRGGVEFLHTLFMKSYKYLVSEFNLIPTRTN